MQGLGLKVGLLLVLVIVAVAGCSTAERDDEVTGDSPVETVEEPQPSFFFPQTPIVVDVPAPTALQLDEIDNADVPVRTMVFIATTGLDGSSSRSGEIQITDMVRGSQSGQQIKYVLIGSGHRADAVVGSAAPGSCDQPGNEPVTVRGVDEACADPATGVVSWVEDGNSYQANSAVAGSTDALIDWVGSLELIELGNAAGPYNSPFCSEDPARCTG